MDAIEVDVLWKIRYGWPRGYLKGETGDTSPLVRGLNLVMLIADRTTLFFPNAVRGCLTWNAGK
jgi:hypothetical protein